jgi:hypothetical protein
MAKPLLSEATYSGILMYKKSEAFKELHEEHFDRRYLPNEFGGKLGAMDNSNFTQKVMEMEDYFREIQKSTKKS